MKLNADNTYEMELSVIVPVYNVEKYLERCMDSILNQTYQVDEIICIDDGSTDSCGSILDAYAERENRIKVVHKENGGLVNARKTGISLAHGKYIAYVDSDDWIDSDMYEKMMDVIRKTDADIVTAGLIRDYGSHQVVEDIYIPEGLYEGEALKRDLLGKLVSVDSFFQNNISVALWNKIFKREVLLPYQMKVNEQIEMGEDLVCCYPCMLNAEKIAVTHYNHYHYCMRGDSMVGIRKENEAHRCEILFRDLYEEFCKYPEIPNIKKQFIFLKYHYLLLRQMGKVVSWESSLLFPFGQLEKSEKIVIYGSGRFGCELKAYLERMNANIVAWVDENDFCEVKKPQYLQNIEYDKIIIAVLRSELVAQIKTKLREINVKDRPVLSVDAELLWQNMSEEQWG